MSYLKYRLVKDVDNELHFQILEQSPKVKAFFKFLATFGQTSYLTKTGYKVAISDFPEFKISQNTIYLRGSKSSQDRKVDVTRFVNNGTYRKGSEKMLKAALKEFGKAVGKADDAGLLSGFSGCSFTLGSTPRRVVTRVKKNPLASMNVLGGSLPFMVAPRYATSNYREFTNMEAWLCNRVMPTHSRSTAKVIYV